MSKSYVATHCTLTDFLMHIAHKKWQELVEDRITNLPGSRDVPSFWKLGVVFVKYQADNEDNCVSFLSISECLNLLIVVFESLNCPQREKIDLKIIQYVCWKGYKYAKVKIPQDMEDFSEEQRSF